MRNTLIPGAPGQTHRFTPVWYNKRVPKPAYVLRSCSLRERAQYLADIDTECGGEIYQFEFDAAFREGLAAILPDREDAPENAALRARIVDALDADRSGQKIAASEQAILDEAWATVKRQWAPMRALERRSVLRANFIPAIALKQFCVGLEHITDRDGKPIVWEADDDGQLTDQAILRIDPLELKFAGNFAHNLQFGASAEKNSDSPSKSGEAPEASTAVSEAPGGSKRTRAGRKR
jgi:hypothetical protein